MILIDTPGLIAAPRLPRARLGQLRPLRVHGLPRRHAEHAGRDVGHGHLLRAVDPGPEDDAPRALRPVRLLVRGPAHAPRGARLLPHGVAPRVLPRPRGRRAVPLDGPGTGEEGEEENEEGETRKDRRWSVAAEGGCSRRTG